MPLFTPQTARFMAARSAEGRRQAKLLRLQRDQMLDRLIQEANDRTVQPAAHAPKDDECPDMARRIEMAQGLEDHMKRLDQMMQEERQPSSLAHLAGARGKIFETWRILGGIPMPGSRRPSAERPRQVAQFTPPVDS